MTHDLSTSLQELIQRELPLLQAFSETSAGLRPSGDDSWSPKEELGHLIDSAANNHIRFARALIEPELRGPTYAQNDWVRIHRYHEMLWKDITDFWYRYNFFLTSLLNSVPDDKLQTACFIGAGESVTLQFLVSDYVHHAQHHIDHLLARQHVAAYP